MPSVRSVRARSPLGIAALAFAALLTTSCEDFASFFNPCGSTDGTKGLDGVWVLKKINGSTLTGAGFLLPGSNVRLVYADLNFSTLTIDESTCNEPKQSSGEVWAYYKFTKSDGTTDKPQIQVGRFEFVNSSRKVILHALDSTATGSASLTGYSSFNPSPPSPSIMTVTAPIRAPNIRSTTYTLEFHR